MSCMFVVLVPVIAWMWFRSRVKAEARLAWLASVVALVWLATSALAVFAFYRHGQLQGALAEGAFGGVWAAMALSTARRCWTARNSAAAPNSEG